MRADGGPAAPDAVTAGQRRASLVAVGDELLSGATTDLNSPACARRLGELGFEVVRTTVVGDDEDALARALGAALDEADVVLVSGGLGPTLDDLTRHAAARAVGRDLESSEEAWRGIVAWYARRGGDIPASNRRQALLPSGAEILPNAVGTAPGFTLEHRGARLFSLPGPPFEMRTMLEEAVVPRLTHAGGAALALHRFYLFGLSESVFADQVGDWMARGANPLLGCSVKGGVLTATLRSMGADPAAAGELLADRAQAFRERFGEHVFSETEPRLEAVLGRRLIQDGVSVSAAESCTAGLALALLGRVPGVSAVLERGFVTYSNRAKVEVLGVPPDLLDTHGAVSEPVAGAMAAGAAQRAGARAAVGISGIAGPDGGSDDKPVGTVCFGTVLDGEVRTETRRFPPTSRDFVRNLAARAALFLLLRRLPAPPGDRPTSD